MTNNLEKKTRIEIIDVLRAFAIILICLAHNIIHYSYNVYPEQNYLDYYLTHIVFEYATGKGYALFALLFGFTFSIQYQSQLKKNVDFGYRFLWRMFLLTFFAILNTAFYSADFLMLYAILGITLFLTRKLGDKTILMIATIMFLQPLQWLSMLSSSYHSLVELVTARNAQRAMEIDNAILSGDFFNFIKTNINVAIIRNIESIVNNSRTTQSIGLFLLGVILHRRKLFIPSPSTNKFWVFILIICSLLIPSINISFEGEVHSILTMWHNLLFTFVLISSIVLLYQIPAVQNSLNILKNLGRMSMTNYISQSIMSIFIYYPLGLNLAPKCGALGSILIAIMMITLQIIFSNWWLKRHNQGPLEGIWHKLTWLGKK